MSPLAVYGAVPAVITTNVAFRGPRPWADPRAFGARGDAVKVAAAGATTRSSTTITLTGFNLTSADVGKLVSIRDLSAPQRVSTGAMTISTNVVTATGAGFVSTDVGKSLQIGGAGNYGVFSSLLSTITGYTSATQVTVADNALATVSARNVAWQNPAYVGVIASVLSATQATVTVAPTMTMSASEATLGTDDTAAIQAAVSSTSGTVALTGGRTVSYLVNGKITIGAGVRLQSDGAVIIRHAGASTTLFELSAGGTGVRFDRLTIDAQHVASLAVITALNATADVAVDGCEFRDIGPGRLLYWVEGATQHRNVRITRNRTSRRLPRQGAHYDSENVQSIQVHDASFVEIHDNEFSGLSATTVGAITPATCPVTNPMQHVSVARNRFADVFPTTLFIDSLGGSPPAYLTNVEVSNNTFERCGVWCEKGSIYGVLDGGVSNLSITGNRIRGGGSNGATAGYAEGNAAQLLGLVTSAAGPARNILISGNQIDGRTDSGTSPSGLSMGIFYAGPGETVSIIDNQVAYVGWHGIQTLGLSTGGLGNLMISGNRVNAAVTASDNTWQGAGISVLEYATAPVISNNTCLDTGAGGSLLTRTAGIAIGGYNSGTSSEGRGDTVTSPILRGNRCADVAASRQQYGILLGYSGATYHPTTASVDGNDVSGNVTAGIWYDQATSRSHRVGRNPGYNAGYGHPVYYNAALAYTGTGTFTIPIIPQPFVGLLVAESKFGDISAVNFYHVLRNVSSGYTQALSAVFGAVAIGGGVAPTIVSTTPTTGTFTVTNNEPNTPALVAVYLVPLNWANT